ncbi:MAG: hypothetical protein U9N52_11555 [Campylobacterota bacterium]|nr:hypothetical protein [Campylobacterota bacterium]
MARRGKSLFSLSTLLASFFGAAMIAGAFAYFNYKFSEYKFINFSEWIFYEKTDLFKPQSDRYIVLFYSSNKPGAVEAIKEVKAKYPIVAIDYYQQSVKSSEKITFVKSGTSTMLKFIQRFNIYDVPTVFIIKKVKESLYKQDSMIRKLDTNNKLNLEGL